MSDIPSDRLREDAEGVGSLSTCNFAGAHGNNAEATDGNVNRMTYESR